MAKVTAAELGSESIDKLLFKQAVPASIGILVMSINILVDSIFVGKWIGSIAIAAINVVLPVSFFIAALGMAIGIGGSSIISRALGANNKEKALTSFGNMITLTVLVTIALCVPGLLFADSIIPGFGGKGAIFSPAKIYYTIVLCGVPFLALCMMGNNVIRAEGKPKFAMVAMIIPTVANLLMDYLFINVLKMGMYGAAWATTISYFICFVYILSFFLGKQSELKINYTHFSLKREYVSEISALGFVTLARQAVVSITYLLMNNILYKLGGETMVTVYAIVGRMLMFVLFPVLGITQGFLPIAGFNYGARKYQRVREVINKSIFYASAVGLLVFLLIFFFPDFFINLFLKSDAAATIEETRDNAIILAETTPALRWVFAATPIVALQLIGSAYFQAIGKAIPALLLTLLRQGILFIPLVLILPKFYGVFGVWVAFPVADVLATVITAIYLNSEVRKNLLETPQ